MKTSVQGRGLIEKREGRRLSAYRDTRGILTIGVGHTGRMSPPSVRAIMTITEAECDVMLAADLAPVEAVINAAVTVPITQNEFDAMASLGFNIGAHGLRGSTVLRKLNLGDIHGAADAFMAWSKPAILAGRRRDEMAQFLERDSIDPAATHAVTVARVASLTSQSSALKSKARVTTFGGATTTAIGVVAAGGGGMTHHHGLALVVGLLLLVGLAIDVFVIWQRLTNAKTLQSNAQIQTSVAITAKP